ncbi:MAG: hypothetical protein PHG61_09845 [Candidatus Marinimicrobia bacterium]|nr:hypothetical protein [Candidatus Neomarinimicrobiota bacterium]
MFNWLRKKKTEPEHCGDWYLGKWCSNCHVGLDKDIELCPKCGTITTQYPIIRYRVYYRTLDYYPYVTKLRYELHHEDIFKAGKAGVDYNFYEMSVVSDPPNPATRIPDIPKTVPPDPPDPPPSRLEDCLSFAGFDAGHNRVNIENERRTANDCEQIRIANLYISRITQHIDRTIAEVKGFITDKEAFIVPTHINTGKDPKEMKANLILAIRHLEDARMRMGRVIHYLYHPFITTDGDHPHRPKVMPSLADKGYSPTGEPHKPTTDTDIANLPELPSAPPIRIINENDRPSRDFDMEAKDAPME